MILKFIFLLNIGATQEPNAIIFEQEKSDLYIIEQEAEVTINFTYTIIEPKKPNKYCNIDQNRSLKAHFLNIITELLTGTVTGSSKTREKRQVLSIISALAGFEFSRLFFSNDNHNSITQIESAFNNKLETLECQMYSKLGRLEENEIENALRIEILNFKSEIENLSKDIKSDSKTKMTRQIFSTICEKHSFVPKICDIYSNTGKGSLSSLNIVNSEEGLFILFTLSTKIPKRFKKVLVNEIYHLNLPIFNEKKDCWEKRPDSHFFQDTNNGLWYSNKDCIKSGNVSICRPYTSTEDINKRQLQLKKDQCFYSKYQNNLIIVKKTDTTGNYTYINDENIVKSSPLKNQNILPLNRISKIHLNCGNENKNFYSDENFNDTIKFNLTFTDFDSESDAYFTIFRNKPDFSSLTLVFVVIFCSALFLTAGITILFKRFPTIRITKCIKKSNKKIKDRNTLSDIASIDSVFSFTTVPNTHHRSLPISLSNPNLNFNNRATRGRACFARPCRNRLNTRTPSTFSVYHE